MILDEVPYNPKFVFCLISGWYQTFILVCHRPSCEVAVGPATKWLHADETHLSCSVAQLKSDWASIHLNHSCGHTNRQLSTLVTKRPQVLVGHTCTRTHPDNTVASRRPPTLIYCSGSNVPGRSFRGEEKKQGRICLFVQGPSDARPRCLASEEQRMSHFLQPL